MAQDFVENFAVPFPVFTDPKRSSYQLAGLHRNVGLGVATIRRAKRALTAGHRQGSTQGDPWQQGGVIIVDTDGSLVWRHVDSGAGDHGAVADVMTALNQMR